MSAKKKVSGRNIPEAERGTVQVKLRLPPEVAEELDEVAQRWGVTRSGAVAKLLDVYRSYWE
jgi:predicted DNA-binding protein